MALVIAGLSAAVVYLLATREGARSAAAPSAVVSVSAEPASSPSFPSPPGPAPPVAERFTDHRWVEGQRLSWRAEIFKDASDDCQVHTFTRDGRTLGAYDARCHSWKASGYNLVIFYVTVRNLTDAPVPFDLHRFFLAGRDARVLVPVEVGTQAASSRSFLPEMTVVPPRTRLLGYLTFDDGVTGLVPSRLTYLDGEQELTVVFDGKLGVK